MKRHFPLLIALVMTLSAAVITAVATPPQEAAATVGQALVEYPFSPPTPTIAQLNAPQTLSSDGAGQLITPSELLSSWQVVDIPGSLPNEGGRWIMREGLLAQDGLGPTANLSGKQTLLLSPVAASGVGTAFYDQHNGTVGLVAHYSNAGYYRVRLQRTGQGEANAQSFVLEKVRNGEVITLAEAIGASLFDRYIWHTIRLHVTGTRVGVTLDGRPLAIVSDPTPLPAGRVGLLTHALGGISFANITVEAQP